MRISPARRAAIIGAAVITALVPLSGTAQAAPAPAQPSLPAALSTAVERDLHMTVPQYLDRAALAQKLGRYADQLHKSDPHAYAGAWLDTNGTPIVAVTTDAAARKVAAAGFRPKRAQFSADTLNESLGQLNQWVAALPDSISRQIKSAAVDMLNNQIVLTVINSDLGRAISLPDLAAKLKVDLAPGGPGRIESAPIGGDTYVTTAKPLNRSISANQITVCSFGFSATDAAGNPLAISAGHCDPNPSAAGTSGAARVYLPNVKDIYASTQVGSFARSGLGNKADGLDYSVIKLDSSAATKGLDQPVVRGARGTTITITGTAAPVVGAPVCKSGQTSGYTCGVVLAANVSTKLYASDGSSRTVHGFADSACTLSGDSGGAIVSGTLAMGITSGSNSDSAPDCRTANLSLAADGGTVGFGMSVQSIVNEVDAKASQGSVGDGLRIRTAP
ncbi:S1 family peptidase [Speluncibacter jeojiensis]|uniref:S1 family peptidase n=1 Tax=Speluncibacter jeojiensis TaxID=2710754 RepID=A0A9X4M2B0_9ACTN|nr:S1 family peptidase [Corynebacteriales bacterium D3-21]